MTKYRFVIEATISMHCEVEAESLEEAIEAAKGAPIQSLCHQCGSGESDEWRTSGELDFGDPSCCPLVEVLADEEELDGVEW